MCRLASFFSWCALVATCLVVDLSIAQDQPQQQEYSEDMLFTCHIGANLANSGESVYWSDLDSCNAALAQEQNLSRVELLATLQNRAVLLMELTEFDRARDDLERASSLDPESAEVQINLGMLYFVEQNFDEAIEYFSLVAESSEQRSLALFNRALSFGYSGELDLALQDLALLKQEFPQEFSQWVNSPTSRVFPELVAQLEEF
jgi:lipoprotein NlpI